MAHRIGVCQSCRARFQIPASFAPNRAKCRSCGGVVSIGPAEGAPGRVEAPPATARAPEPVVREAARAPAPIPPIAAPAPALERSRPAELAPALKTARKTGLVRALLVAGIAAVLAIGSWILFS